MKILSWNVNGIRAATKKGFFSWFEKEKADVVCIQETKAEPNQLEKSLSQPKGYFSFWHSAQRKGYSGVAIFSKSKPLKVQEGINVPEVDSEGRVLIAKYPTFTLLNAYFPNSQPDHARLPFKLRFCEHLLKFCNQLLQKKENLILVGDYNIAHKEIDLANPKANQNNAGFLPEERAWMDQFVSQGYVDLFRKFSQEPNQYTWWTYRFHAREKNIGWRIDYACSNQGFADQILGCRHQPQIFGSDHCPVEVHIK